MIPVTGEWWRVGVRGRKVVGRGQALARRGSFLVLTALWSALPAAAQVPHPEELPRYRVQVAADLGNLAVEACFPAPAPGVLVAGNAVAPALLRDLAADSGEVHRRGRRLLWRHGGEAGCLRYRVDLRAASHRAVQLGHGALVADADLWLWLPRWPQGQPAPGSLALHFLLPAGMGVMAPWPLVDYAPDADPVPRRSATPPGTGISSLPGGQSHAGSRVGYRVSTTPSPWGTLVAVGAFRELAVSYCETRARVAVLTGSPPGDQAVARWLRSALQGAYGLYGSLPARQVKVIVQEGRFGSGPVPFGRVVRGGGPVVQLFVRPGVEQALAMDWTAVHEFTHLALPFIDRHDAWLSEGITSYYQNVLLARIGRISPNEAWRRLLEGFGRGRAQSDGTRSLAQETAALEITRNYMRVYWSGVAYALELDLLLRAGVLPGVASLDETLAALAACCLPSEQVWSGERLVRQLDELAGGALFEPAYRRWRRGLRFPDSATTRSSEPPPRWDAITAPATAGCGRPGQGAARLSAGQ